MTTDRSPKTPKCGADKPKGGAPLSGDKRETRRAEALRRNLKRRRSVAPKPPKD